MTVEQALSADNVAEERGKLVDAKQFLVAALADGTVAVKDLMQQVKRAGHVKRTIERAKQQLGVRSEQPTELQDKDPGQSSIRGLPSKARARARCSLLQPSGGATAAR